MGPESSTGRERVSLWISTPDLGRKSITRVLYVHLPVGLSSLLSFGSSDCPDADEQQSLYLRFRTGLSRQLTSYTFSLSFFFFFFVFLFFFCFLFVFSLFFQPLPPLSHCMFSWKGKGCVCECTYTGEEQILHSFLRVQAAFSLVFFLCSFFISSFRSVLCHLSSLRNSLHISRNLLLLLQIIFEVEI